MGPRYLDPMTTDEQGVGGESRPAIDYFANTSTMEYQLERFGETVGLGTYDLHSMKALYGRVLETFDDRVVPLGGPQRAFAAKAYSQLVDRDFVVDPGKSVFAHYTQTARAMKVFDAARDCRAATEDEKAQASWRVVHGKVCSPAPKDHWGFEDFSSEEIPEYGLSAAKWHVVDKEGKDRVRWHYRYGEQYGAGGYMHTSMGDAGADIFELVQNLSQRFKLSYPWTYFRRNNGQYDILGIPQAVSSQYFMKARAYHWQVASAIGRGRALELGDDNGLRPHAMAQGELLSFLASAVLQPEPGEYAENEARTPTGSLRIFDLVSSEQVRPMFSIGIIDGRYIGEKFDDVRGGSWDYQKFVSRAGFEVEKAMAMMQIVDTRPTLFSVSREGSLDERANMLSFRTDLPSAVDRILGGVLSEDWETIAPAVLDPKAPEVVPVDFTRAAARTPDARVVFPNIGYKQQLQMAIFAAVFSRLGADMTLVEKMRLSLDGDRAPLVPGARRIEFSDPQTGFLYFANRFGDEVVGGKTVDKGISSRVLQRANQLVTDAYEVKRDAAGNVVLDAAGKPSLALDASGVPVVKSATADGALRRYVGLLDSLRQITRALGEGPLGD